MQALGGIEMTRQIHHVCDGDDAGHQDLPHHQPALPGDVLRVPWTMMPVIEDFKHLFTRCHVLFWTAQT